MVETKLSLDEYLTRILKIRKADELLKVLDEFRRGDWTDLERQKVAHTYMRVLDSMPKAMVETAQKPEQAPVDDGPVWYEKM